MWPLADKVRAWLELCGLEELKVSWRIAGAHFKKGDADRAVQIDDLFQAYI